MTNHRPGEIDATKCGVAYCEHHREGLPYCVECREESTLAHDKACALLAEARAEIERLKLVSQNQETVIAAQRRSAKAKNELIEQMREALRLTADEYSLHVSRYENRNAHDDPCYIAAEQALAAERGEL